MLSVFDIFKVGIGPSSSHTVGPMRIAVRFLEDARAEGALDKARRVKIDLHGSLALTGVGHGTDKACILGLMGFEPENTDPDEAEAAFEKAKTESSLQLAHGPLIGFNFSKDIDLRGDIVPEIHPNEMRLSLFDEHGATLFEHTYYSVGGGFIATEVQLTAEAEDDLIARPRNEAYFFASAKELLAICNESGRAIHEIILANEDSLRTRAETEAGLDAYLVRNAQLH